MSRDKKKEQVEEHAQSVSRYSKEGELRSAKGALLLCVPLSPYTKQKAAMTTLTGFSLFTLQRV